jgi:hypothetical protein
MSVEQLVEWDLTGRTEIFWENLPQFTLCSTNPTRSDLGSNQGRRGGKPATNRLSYGTAMMDIKLRVLNIGTKRKWQVNSF